jgi:Fe-S cluster assembly iron-binding protein IscA
MLKLTPKAIAALTAARSEAGAPETHGVRFFAQESEPGRGASVAFKFVADPLPDDAVTDVDGLRTFVAPEIRRMVGEGTVDIEMAGPRAQLILRPW